MKKKILTIMSMPLLLAGITSNIIQEDKLNGDSSNVSLKEANQAKLASKTINQNVKDFKKTLENLKNQSSEILRMLENKCN